MLSPKNLCTLKLLLGGFRERTSVCRYHSGLQNLKVEKNDKDMHNAFKSNSHSHKHLVFPIIIIFVPNLPEYEGISKHYH